jgi:hypothetical protein
MEARACWWCEYLSTFADLIGFIGAGFLAYPFLRGQKLRDQALAIDTSRIPDPEDTAVFSAAKHDLTREILTRVRVEYRAAWLGAALIACAFIGRFASALPHLFPCYFGPPP